MVKMENCEETQPLLCSFNGVEDETGKSTCLILQKQIKKPLNELHDFAHRKAGEMGRWDPRKIIFGIKMGLALSIVSSLIFFKAIKNVSRYSIWATLTIILMFEYTIGATFIKSFNQLLGTLCAAIIAFCFAELSLMVGKSEEAAIVCSIFIMGFFGSNLKLYPTMKPYEYGFRVFILSYCILMIAGSRTSEYTEGVVTRLVLIALSACVCLIVNVSIYIIWSGHLLHSSVVTNFKDVADSLQGCVDGYLKFVEYERFPSKILTHQAYDDPLYNGYRSVVELTSKEENLLGFANWVPAYGRFKMLSYPWRNYVEVCGALRHFEIMVIALHGCIISEIQAPAAMRQVFQSEVQRVGAEAAKVLRELGCKLGKKETLGPSNILKDVHEAAEQLQRKIDEKAHLLIKSDAWEIARQPMELQNQEQSGSKSLSETVLDLRSVTTWTPSLPTRCSSLGSAASENESKKYGSARASSLASFAYLLIECVARLRSLVDVFEELSEKAEFMEPTVNCNEP